MAGTIYRHITWATVALLGIGSVAIWSFSRTQSADEEWTRLLHNKQPGDIHQIDIEHASNIWILGRDEHIWRLKQQNLPSIQSEIDDLASLLVHIQVQSVLQPEDLAEYGLDSPVTTLNVHTHDDQNLEVRIGDPTPDLMHDYLLVDNDVYLSRTRISLSVIAIEEALLNTSTTLRNALE